MKTRCLLIFAALSIGFFADAFAQQSFEERRSQVLDRQQTTRGQIENLENQIETYQERLGFATDRYEQTYQRYEELTRLIALQKENIRQTERERRQINEEIQIVQEKITDLETRLELLIDEYKKTLTYIYKHGRTTELALLLTANSINQLMVRSYYLSKFDEHRQQQAEEIEQSRIELENTREDLEDARERNRETLASIQKQTSELEAQEEQLETNISLLQRDRNNLEEQLNIFQNQRNELTNVLDQLDAEEERIRQAEEERERRLAEARLIEDDEERRAAEARYSAPVSSERAVTNDELLRFEASFAEMRGQLPWPVDNGTITEKFGTRVHPVFNTRTNNPGVEIAAPPASTVRMVADGYIYSVQNMPGYGELVFVSHGDYKTVYGNLSSIYVRENQTLQKGEVIGLSGDYDSVLGEVLFFSVREDGRLVNPEVWLQRSLP